MPRRFSTTFHLLRAVAAIVLATAVVAALVLWVSTPAGNDLPARVAATASAAGVPVLTPEQVPHLLAQAIVAVEDERFFSHHGPDTIGLARAVVVDVTQRCACEGGSTITQQLVNLTYYPDTGRLARKLPSMAVAFKVETQTSKPVILADYLSIAPMGRGVVGARAGACTYFGHDLSKLSLAEAAELAGMPQAPSADDPRFAPDRTRARRSDVLTKMVELGMIDAAAGRAAAAEPVLARRNGC